MSSDASAPTLPRKRKADDDSAPSDGEGEGAQFKSGLVTCETCTEAVSFRDEDTGAFTTKHWDAHRANCSNAAQAPGPLETIPYTPSSSGEPTPGQPASKRRRAKRSEDERIEYLRSDPYVAQFEAYRVLCGSCNKWIRLRPNSTYCSIPWDAHRRSCLAKKGSKVNGTEDRNTAFASDPDIKKFDGERVHCALCNRWVAVGADDHAVHAWTQHRAHCQTPAASASGIPSVPPPSQHQMALASMPAHPRTMPSTPHAKTTPDPPSPVSGPSSASKDKEFAPAQPPPDAARRRNAVQREALLRGDPLLTQVEPNRVFCSLCRKWVQLRQDSTYCAYPWQQHRGKCLLRHGHKVSLVAGEPGSVAEATVEGAPAVSPPGGSEPQAAIVVGSNKVIDAGSLAQKEALVGTSPEAGHVSPRGGHEHVLNVNVKSDSEGVSMDVDGPSTPATPQKPYSPPPLADLSSPSGRSAFVMHAIVHLFHTTYTPADALSVAALVAYLNAAMPPGKHEHVQPAEVVRAVRTSSETHAHVGAVALEGDMIRYSA
ncbi:hypothetical protein FA95DRAFT_1672021 [Auriscalpium vulgare]|uniref:Uncharacterized protein n=1 Tax=Auriscalpium vulgare TaxID=40419 RepID=A0ACB8RPF3_9AGAM|nr:hypothetical protein FA95DRAFT_1672021 [Auriscalpium vulgare]